MTRSLGYWLSCLLLLVCCWSLAALPAFADTAPAAAAPSAQALFQAQCAGCHAHGGNIIRRGKNLKQRALKRHGVDSVEAISALITNGKGAMSAYQDRLSTAEIDQLAHYVWTQAETNWQSE